MRRWLIESSFDRTRTHTHTHTHNNLQLFEIAFTCSYLIMAWSFVYFFHHPLIIVTTSKKPVVEDTISMNCRTVIYKKKWERDCYHKTCAFFDTFFSVAVIVGCVFEKKCAEDEHGRAWPKRSKEAKKKLNREKNCRLLDK